MIIKITFIFAALSSGSSSMNVFTQDPPYLINEDLIKLASRIGNQAPPKKINYASVTNQFGNEFDSKNINGNITVGSETIQKYNDFRGTRSHQANQESNYGSVSDQFHNTFQFTHVGGDLTVGSNTLQENNAF